VDLDVVVDLDDDRHVLLSVRTTLHMLVPPAHRRHLGALHLGRVFVQVQG
jgi:hypothetical protein